MTSGSVSVPNVSWFLYLLSIVRNAVSFANSVLYRRDGAMKLENISKIFGVLAFISFVLTIWEIAANYSSTPKYTFLGATIIFLLAAIMTTLKRIARGIEESEKK